MVVNHKAAPRKEGGPNIREAALNAPSYQHCDTHGNELDRLVGMDIPSTVSQLEYSDDRKRTRNGQSLE